jgi:hypothetical protein
MFKDSGLAVAGTLYSLDWYESNAVCTYKLTIIILTF